MDIQKRLSEASRLLKEREKLLHRRETIENMMQEQKVNLTELEKQLSKEGKDL